MKKELLFIFFIVLFDLLGFGIVIPILPYYAEAFGAGGWEIGWLMTSYSLTQFLVSPIWGRISDRIGRKPVLLASILGGSLAMIWTGLASSLTELFIARIFAGFCAANISTAYAYVADVTTEKERTRAMGLIGAGFGLGFTFGPAIGGILSEYGFSIPMFFAAALAGANFLFGMIALREKRKPEGGRKTQRARLSDIPKILKIPSSGLAISLFFLFTLATTQLEVVFAIFMEAQYQYNAKSTGFLLFIFGMTMVLTQGGIIRPLSKRLSEIQIAGIAMFLGTIALIVFASSQGLAVAIPALCALAIARGMAQPSLSSLASFGASPQNRGITMGIFHSGSSLARVLGPISAGWLYDEVNRTAPFWTSALILVLAFGIISASRLKKNAK